MKIIGVVGGLGPESTIDYYRLLIAAYRELRPDGSYPRIMIDSIDMKTVLGLVESGDLSRLAEHIAEAVTSLAAAGAQIGLLASNTPRVVFDEIQRRSPLPLVSIVESARDAAQALGV